MKKQVQESVEYFRSNPGYHRILAALRQKYQSFGRPAGTVCLPDASGEECDAARRIFGRFFSPPLRFRTVQFEAELQHRFPDVCLKEVLEAYFGAELHTRREERETLDGLLSAMLTRAVEATQGESSIRWLQTLEAQRGAAWSLLRREAMKNRENAQSSLLLACRGMDRLTQGPKTLVRLAVLSAEATSDPHALDGERLSGKLFQHLLAFHSGSEFPGNAEQRDRLYYENGILCDSISSLVTQVGLVLSTESGEHPAYRAFWQRRAICTLSLASFSGLTEAQSPTGRAYIVENEMVFTQLCDRASQFSSPLICTSGQPSVAALRLMDLLAASGTTLFYSGDFDGKGLSIAAQLCTRYPDLLKPWHMAAEDYDRCRSDISLSSASLSLLQGCAGTVLENTAQLVEKHRRAGYQELLILQLEADLIETP